MNIKGQRVAYLRVSSEGQSFARQEDLRDGTDKVFVEKASGGSRERPVLEELLAYVRDGDTVVVWSLDRLARSVKDLKDIVGDLLARGVTVEFVKEGMKFSPDDSQGPFSKLLFHTLAAFAEFERDVIRERQAEGIAKAKAKGVYKGRAPVLNPTQVEVARSRVSSGVPKAQVARDLGVSRQTLYRALSEA